MPSQRSIVLFGGAFVLLGLIAGGVFGARTLREWNVKRTWRETPCVITRVEYEQQRETTRRRRTVYRPVIAYRYEADGNTHTSTRYALRPVAYRATAIGPLVESYPVGSRQVCYVDPTDPANAVLHLSDFPYPIGTILAVLFIAIGGAIMWSSRRLEREPPAIG